MKKSKKIAISLCVGLTLFTPISPILANEKTNIKVSDKTDNINVISTVNDEFENKGNSIDKACYYAIHGFTYTKPSPSSKRVTIKDTCDYDSTKNYEGLAGVVINAMCKALQDGYLTPYKISWTFYSLFK